MTDRPANLEAKIESYQVTRLNALNHSVLSHDTVLPWENESEYCTLLNALVCEHRPQGPTEEHLVEELAGIIWRKRRRSCILRRRHSILVLTNLVPKTRKAPVLVGRTQGARKPVVTAEHARPNGAYGPNFRST
jgi:hypothetical protein